MTEVELKNKLSNLKKVDYLVKSVDGVIIDSFQKNKEVKLFLLNGINNILKEMYEPLGLWLQNPTSTEEDFGVVINGEWSALNQINTNFSCHEFLFNRCNKYLVDVFRKLKLDTFEVDGYIFSFKTQFQFDSNYFNNKTFFFSTLRKFLTLLNFKRDEIFYYESDIAKRMIALCDDSMRRGNERQDFYIKNINDFFDDITNIKSSKGRGDYDDRKQGVDVWTTHNDGRVMTHQVKGTCSVNLMDDGYSVNSSISPVSKCDYFVFVCGTNRITIFKNDSSKITRYSGSDLDVFDRELLVFDKKYDI